MHGLTMEMWEEQSAPFLKSIVQSNGSLSDFILELSHPFDKKLGQPMRKHFTF